jgi:F-type H+-transporting ATPase subunit gamma
MGLCGAYNSNVLKEFTNKHNTGVDYEAIVVGSKGISKLNYEGIEIYKQYHENSFKTDHDLAVEISRNVLEAFSNGSINNVEIILTKFKNPIVQEVEVLDLFSLDNIVKKEGLVAGVEIEGENENVVFTQLIEMYIMSQVYYALLNSKASEYAMRRTSMETANKNSLELIDKLNLEINRLRQSIITQEIAEIVGGSEALKAKN